LVSGFQSGESFEHGITEVIYLATDASGNQSQCSFLITVNQPPVAEDDYLYTETEINNLSVLGNDYDPDGDEISLISIWSYNDSLVADFTTRGNIEITVFDEWCGIDSLTYVIADTYGLTDTATIILDKPCFVGLELPEGFSPNGDGINETLEIKGIHRFPDHSITILNRWGSEVFFSRNYQNDWDGRSTNEYNFGKGILPVGTYFIILDLGDGSPPIMS